jgi:hypothetical protein
LVRRESSFTLAMVALATLVPAAVAGGGDDAASTPPTVSIKGTTVVEGDDGAAVAVFTLRLSHAADRAVSIRFATVAGSGRARSDYVVRTGVLVFKRSQTSQRVRVRVLGDTVPETEETFFLVLSRPRGLRIKTRRATATIAANDLPAPFELRAEMTGAEYVPPPGHPTGRGTVVLHFDPEGEQLTYTVTVSGMEVGESGLCRGARGQEPTAVLRLDYPPETSGSKHLALATILEMFRAPGGFCALARLNFATAGIRGQLVRASS